MPFDSLFEEGEHFAVLDLVLGRPDGASGFFGGIHQVFVIGQAAGVIEEIADGDVSCRKRENPGNISVSVWS